MLRNLAVVVSFVCLTFVAAIVTSCGSSGTHLGTMCTGGPFVVAGDWQGTFSGGGNTTSAVGVINPAGQALFFDDSSGGTPGSGSVLAMPSITGTCAFSGTATAFGSFGLGNASATVQGNVNSATSISGTISSNSTGSFTLTSFSPLTGSPTSLAGDRGGAIEGASPTLLPLTFTPGTGNNMTFTNNTLLSTCTTSGTVTQEGATNIFDISITFSGAGPNCPAAGTVTGLGFESNTDYFGVSGNPPVSGTYLYAVSADSAFVLEAYPQGAR